MEWASAFEADPTKRISSRRFTGCWLRSVVVISRVSEVGSGCLSSSWVILGDRFRLDEGLGLGSEDSGGGA